MRIIIFMAFWLVLLGFCLVLGFTPVIELWLGEFVLPISVASTVFLVFVIALLRPALRVQTLSWSRLLALASLLSTFGVALMSRLTDGFSCEHVCLGFLNNVLGYACGEWARGCIAEWFSLFLVGFIVALAVLPRLRPNLSFKRDWLPPAPYVKR